MLLGNLRGEIGVELRIHQTKEFSSSYFKNKERLKGELIQKEMDRPLSEIIPLTSTLVVNSKR